MGLSHAGMRGTARASSIVSVVEVVSFFSRVSRALKMLVLLLALVAVALAKEVSRVQRLSLCCSLLTQRFFCFFQDGPSSRQDHVLGLL